MTTVMVLTLTLAYLKKSTGALIIYTEKPQIPAGKSNDSPHYVWETSKNMGC